MKDCLREATVSIAVSTLRTCAVTKFLFMLNRELRGGSRKGERDKMQWVGDIASLSSEVF